MSDVLQDVVFTWRNALKRPGTVLLIIITLALGIGVNTAMFSMAWHVLLAPLPYVDGERLVRLQQNDRPNERLDFRWSGPTIEDYRTQSQLLVELSSYEQQPLSIVGQGDPYLGHAGIVEGNFFSMLGISSLHGRSFTMSDDEDGAEPVMLLSYEFWTNRFNADPAAVGTSVDTMNFTYRIIGVLPPMPAYPHVNEVWIPAISDPFRMAGLSSAETNRGSRIISHVLARLDDGVTLADAELEAETIAARLAANYPDIYPQNYSISLLAVKLELIGDARTTIVLLFALGCLVLLIASANVASLMLAKLASRNQELAIREAVGAAPARIIRQLMTESILFTMAGAVLGLLVAWPCLTLLAKFASGYTPLASEIRMDISLLLFSVFIAVLSGGLCGAAAAIGHRNINQALKEGGDKVTSSVSGKRRRQVLLVVQFALSFFILSTSALIMLSLYRLQAEDMGYQSEQVLATSLSLNIDFSDPSRDFPRQMQNFGQRLLPAVQAIPGVGMAGLYTGAPLLQEVAFSIAFPFEAEGFNVASADMYPEATINMISEDYFGVMDIPLLQGRAFASSDDSNALEVAIVNESFAQRFFPDGNILGKTIRLSGYDDTWKTIVGVVANVRSQDVDQVEGPVVYYSFWQFPAEGINLYVRTIADMDLIAESITDIIHSIDPRQAVGSIMPLNKVKAQWLAPTKLRATLIALFGMLALALTLSGVIGVVSWNVNQRVREIGIHMAIGASPARVRAIFISQGFGVYLVGWLLGLLLMLLSLPTIEPLLYETSARNVPVFLASTVVLTLAVLAAMYIPARKAGNLPPMEALHHE